jgi:hypothetical protein
VSADRPGSSAPTQYDVFLNPLRNRKIYPLVVVLQSPFADLAQSRIVAPAVRFQSSSRVNRILTPRVVVEGQEYLLHIFQLTSVSISDLKDWVADVSDARDQITTALDHLFHDNS